MKTEKGSTNQVERLKRYSYALAALWTVVVSASLIWNLIELRRKTLQAARIQARVAHTKDVDYRSWNAELGGVYVPVSRKDGEMKPNPYLKVPGRDIITSEGEKLTLINPAYMTRMVHHIAENRYRVRGHITSLTPIRPKNAPDAWETEALRQFEHGIKEVSSIEDLDGSSYMRLMRPLITEKGCLQCHASQGYKIGDVRGGISVAVPMRPLWTSSHKAIVSLSVGHALLWILGLVGLYVGAVRLTGSLRKLEISEATLRRNEEQYRTLFENAGVLVSVYDEDGICLLMNGSLANRFGRPQTELVGKSLYELYPERAEECVRRTREVIDHGQTKLYEDLVAFPHGKRWLLSTVHPVRNSVGRIVGAQVVSQDITDRKNSEELRGTVERFTAISDLVNGVAHNFNNLLQIVNGHLELSIVDLENKDYAQVKDTLEKVLERSEAAALTVKRLQTFAELRDDKRVAESNVFDLSQVVLQTIEMSRSWWERPHNGSGITVSIHDSLVEGCFVQGDETQIFSVAGGLIRNAVDAVIESGGGEVRVESFVRDEHVILQVEDTGLGISRQNTERIFNPFFTTKAEQGSGLSLATSREIVVNHGGQILVKSVQGEGSTFSVMLPLAEEPQPSPEIVPHPTLNRTLTVLVVDDEPAIVSLIESWMKKSGHQVLTAGSGEEALGVFNETQPDVVICDLGMPGMNGWEVGKKIREMCEDRNIPKTPFIILTGWGGKKIDSERMAESGVDAVADKPLNFRKLVEVMNQIIDEPS